MTTYSAHAEPGQGLSIGARVEIVKGWSGIVKLGTSTVHHGPLYGSQSAAMAYAKNKAAEYRAYRQKHGQGIEDAARAKAAARETERRMRGRASNKAQAMLDLLRPIVSDMDLVRDELPKQAIARIEAARAVIAYIDTDA